MTIDFASRVTMILMTTFQLRTIFLDVKIGMLTSFHIIDVVSQRNPRSSHIQQMIYTRHLRYLLCSTVFCVDMFPRCAGASNACNWKHSTGKGKCHKKPHAAWICEDWRSSWLWKWSENSRWSIHKPLREYPVKKWWINRCGMMSAKSWLYYFFEQIYRFCLVDMETTYAFGFVNCLLWFTE
jgi:hypothetical protein